MAVTLDFFPRARRDRATPGGVFDPLANAPRTRLFPFHLQGGANTRSSQSSPRLLGPALIRSLVINWGASTAPLAAHSFELGLASAPVEEVAVSDTVARPWQRIMEKIDRATPFVGAAHQGFMGTAVGTNTGENEISVGYVVTQAQWYLVVSQLNLTGIALDVSGHVVVIEGLNPEAVLNFL